MLIRRFFAFVISVFLFLSLPLNAANAASSWSISSVVSAGSRVVVTATKSGYKSAINIAPTAARLGVGLLRIGNTASLIYAASQLASDGVDFVLDPANNRIKYKIPDDAVDGNCTWNFGSGYQKVKASAFCAKANAGSFVKLISSSGSITCTGGTYSTQCTNIGVPTRSISITDAAAQVLKNAKNGNSAAQAAVRDVSTEMVIGGQFDQDLLSGAVPTSDTKPLVPSVPISGNGNDTYGGIGVNDGAVPGTQAGDSLAAAEEAAKTAGAAAEAAKAAEEAAAKAAADAKDLINSDATDAERAAAQAAAEAAAQAVADAKAAAAEAAKAAAEAAAKAAKDTAAAAKAAADAAEAAKAAADAVGATDADRAAAADAAAKAEEAAKAAAEAAAKAEEAAKAIPQEKPFELPAFCSWATPVCDFIDWFKADVPPELAPNDVPFATTSDIGIDDTDRFEQRIQFNGQCPVNDFSFSMMGVTYSKPIPYYHLCGFLEQIAPWLLAMTYLGAAYFVTENL
ncbi:MAG: attachment protein [Inoviridae sp.]|nr:MAG: attachment protein [Inoviridae sp.]